MLKSYLLFAFIPALFMAAMLGNSIYNRWHFRRSCKVLARMPTSPMNLMPPRRFDVVVGDCFNAVRPFAPHEVVTFCNEPVVVIRNDGASGRVRTLSTPPREIEPFFWVFEGEPVVRAARSTC